MTIDRINYKSDMQIGEDIAARLNNLTDTQVFNHDDTLPLANIILKRTLGNTYYLRYCQLSYAGYYGIGIYELKPLHPAMILQ